MPEAPVIYRIDDATLAAAVAARRRTLLDRLADSCGRHLASGSGQVAARLADRLEGHADHFLPASVNMDLLAVHYQDRYRRASIAVFMLAAVALIVVAAQYIFHLPHWIVAGEVSAIAGVLLIFHLGNRRGWHRHWVDCRFLAERMRCGFHVAFLCGRTNAEAEMHWSDRLVEGSWCLAEFERLWRTRPAFEPPPSAALPALADFMKRHWIGRQRSFHEGKERRQARAHRLVSRASSSMFWLTFVTAIVHLLPHGWLHAAHLDRVLDPRLLTFLVIAFPALGSAFTGLRGHFEYKKHAMRSGVMVRLLGELEARLEEIASLEDLYHVVWEAERLMLQENAGWHLNTGFNEIEVEA